jgi:SAM-dependent methyltransferase
MPKMDKAAELNRKAREDHPSHPCLDIDVTALRQCARERAVRLPHPYGGAINPSFVLYDNAHRDVLCLASGGGQQSAFFGILGSRVAVLDIAEAQLEQDRTAAEHYGYPVKTVRGDMRDLSCFEDSSFDHVDMGIAMYAVPDVRPVYREVSRILRPGGTCRIEHMNPATMPMQADSWDGTGYRISVPYRGGSHPPDDPDAYNFRHLFSDIFNGLVEDGLAIQGVWESPGHLAREVHGEPGSSEHMDCIVQCNFAIVARKE